MNLCHTLYIVFLSQYMSNALLGGGVRVRVWIRKQRKTKRRSKATSKPLLAILDISLILYHTVKYLDFSGVYRPPSWRVSVERSHDPGLIQWLLTSHSNTTFSWTHLKGGSPIMETHSECNSVTVSGGEVSGVWKLLPLYTLVPCDQQAYSTDVYGWEWRSYMCQYLTCLLRSTWWSLSP